MLRWSLIFLIIAAISGLFGFGMISGIALSIAKILFYVFLVMAVIFLLAGSLLVKKVKDALEDK